MDGTGAGIWKRAAAQSPVALKVPKIGSLSDDERQTWLLRFQREAETLSRLKHRAIPSPRSCDD